MRVKTYNVKIAIKLNHIANGFELTEQEIENMLITRIKESDKYDFDIKVSKGVKRDI